MPVASRIKALLARITLPKTFGGWLLLLGSIVLFINSKWDEGVSLLEKAKAMSPVWKPVIEVLSSPVTYTVSLIAGAAWIGLAAWLGASRTPAVQRISPTRAVPPEQQPRFSVHTQRLVGRLLVIVVEKVLTECDNVGGPPRKECQCDTCEGWRILTALLQEFQETDIRQP